MDTDTFRVGSSEVEVEERLCNVKSASSSTEGAGHLNVILKMKHHLTSLLLLQIFFAFPSHAEELVKAIPGKATITVEMVGKGENVYHYFN